MLEERILLTLKFFDLQDLAVTLLELHQYLLSSPNDILESSNSLELAAVQLEAQTQMVHISLFEIDSALGVLKKQGKVSSKKGYYTLPNRLFLVDSRLSNYRFGIARERRVNRYLSFTKHIPFIRGIAIGGSQSLGVQSPDSDIDLFVITDQRFIWTARTFLTMYFHILGVRRYATYVSNRFCLNHYLGGVKRLIKDRNIYTAMEYSRLRPVVYGSTIEEFCRTNNFWLSLAFPEFTQYQKNALPKKKQSKIQKALEFLILKLSGEKLERKLGNWQLGRIKRDELILVEPDELSFHHQGKQRRLLASFYEYLNQISAPRIEVDVYIEERIELQAK